VVENNTVILSVDIYVRYLLTMCVSAMELGSYDVEFAATLYDDLVDLLGSHEDL